jgi:hypothetical protein
MWNRPGLQPRLGLGAKTIVGQPSLDSKDDISSLGPHFSCNLTRVVRELYHSQGTLRQPIKGHLPFRQRTRDLNPLQHANQSSALLTLCNTCFHQYQPAVCMAITSKRGAWTKINTCVLCSWYHFRTWNAQSCRPYYLPVQTEGHTANWKAMQA